MLQNIKHKYLRKHKNNKTWSDRSKARKIQKSKKKCFSGVIFKNIIVSELIQMKTGFKCLFEDLNDVIGNLSWQHLKWLGMPNVNDDN